MFATLAELKTALINECARNEAEFQAKLGQFVTAGERLIFDGVTPLRCKEMEQRSDALVVTNGTATAPDGFRGARRLTWNATPPVPLVYRTPDQFFIGSIVQGTPRLYTVEDEVITVAPTATGTATLTYHARPTGLQADTDTNDVLTTHGEVYLFAASVYAYSYLRNYEKMAEFKGQLTEAIEGINRAANEARYGAAHLAPVIPGAYSR